MITPEEFADGMAPITGTENIIKLIQDTYPGHNITAEVAQPIIDLVEKNKIIVINPPGKEGFSVLVAPEDIVEVDDILNKWMKTVKERKVSG